MRRRPPADPVDGGRSRGRRCRRITRYAAQAGKLATARGLKPTLTAQPIRELNLARRYGTIFICDSFGIGGPRSDDLEGLRRVLAHLEPGGALVFSHHLPYGDEESEWLRWLPHRHGETQPWPEAGDRRRAADGDELELVFRERSWDPLLQRSILEVRTRRWHDHQLVEEEEHAIVLSAYFAQEVVTMLERWASGCGVQTPTRGRRDRDDVHVVFIARCPLEGVRRASALVSNPRVAVFPSTTCRAARASDRIQRLGIQARVGRPEQVVELLLLRGPMMVDVTLCAT